MSEYVGTMRDQRTWTKMTKLSPAPSTHAIKPGVSGQLSQLTGCTLRVPSSRIRQLAKSDGEKEIGCKPKGPDACTCVLSRSRSMDRRDPS